MRPEGYSVLDGVDETQNAVDVDVVRRSLWLSLYKGIRHTFWTYCTLRRSTVVP